MQTRLQRFIRPAVRDAQAYAIADATGLVKLDAMENPYALPAGVREQLSAALCDVPVHRYPDPGAADLKRILREQLEIPGQHAMLLGNGSDELIQIIAMAVAGPGVTLLSPEPGFVMYRLIAAMTGCRFVGVDLVADDFSLNADAMLAAIATEQPAVVFLAWPNNPTGNLFDPDVVLDIIRAAPGLVVIDEAYHAFADSSLLPLLTDHDHVVILRTLSKLGLAGLRIGLMLGAPAWIDEFDKLRLPYNLGAFNQTAAVHLLSRSDVFASQVALIKMERERLQQELQSMPGVQVWPSSTNFLLFRVNAADQVFAGLLERGVMIKKLHGSHPLLHDCLRVTAGTPGENNQFLEALGLVLKR